MCCLAEGPSPFKPHVNGLILVAVALVLFAKTMTSLFRTAIWVSTQLLYDHYYHEVCQRLCPLKSLKRQSQPATHCCCAARCRELAMPAQCLCCSSLCYCRWQLRGRCCLCWSRTAGQWWTAPSCARSCASRGARARLSASPSPALQRRKLRCSLHPRPSLPKSEGQAPCAPDSSISRVWGRPTCAVAVHTLYAVRLDSVQSPSRPH